MPLFDLATYRTKLGITTNSNDDLYLAGFLVFLENYLLTNYGLEFGNTSSTRVLQQSEDAITIIPTPFVRDITKVEIKSYSNTSYSKVLVVNEDYITQSIKTSPNPIYVVRLLKESIKLPFYVEITGKWSFADSIPSDISGCVIDLFQVGIGNFRYNKGLMDKSGKSINRTKIGDVEVSFGSGNSSRDTDYISLISSSLLSQILNSNYKYD